MKPDGLSHPHACVELARAWVAIAKSAMGDASMNAGNRQRTVDEALANGRESILAARKKGWFQTSEDIQKFHGEKEFEPIWDVFPQGK
jgi:hypothetical protein